MGLQHNSYQSYFLLAGGRYSKENCQGVRILESFNFFPLSWYQADVLKQANTADAWKKVFERSYSVDFYNTSGGKYFKVMKPKFYGGKLPAYAYLGPKYCPLSFSSEKLF